jgi:cytolysin-activating lysine-acyltransferase
MIDLIAPFGGVEEAVKEIKEKILAGRTIKTLQPAPDGKGVMVVEW